MLPGVDITQAYWRWGHPHVSRGLAIQNTVLDDLFSFTKKIEAFAKHEHPGLYGATDLCPLTPHTFTHHSRKVPVTAYTHCPILVIIYYSMTGPEFLTEPCFSSVGDIHSFCYVKIIHLKF